MRRLASIAAILLLVALPAHAQQVRMRGHGEAEVDAMLTSALADHPLVFVRDTVIGVHDTIKSNVLVINARLIVEGTIVGDLTGVHANMYLRPPARVTGRVLNVAGGLYQSEQAHVGSADDRSLASYEVVADGNDLIIQGLITRPAIKWLGAFRIPDYNRVDGLVLEGGPSILLPNLAGFEPVLNASIGYAFERTDALGRVQLKFKRRLSAFAVGWEDDVTLTNEEWISNAPKNLLNVILKGKDYRNYYLADRTYAEFQRTFEQGKRTSKFWLRAQNELAHPVLTGDPWVVFKPDSFRFNPPVPSSRIASGFIGAETETIDSTFVWGFSGSLEFAPHQGTSLASFNAYRAHANFAMKAIANHTLRITGEFRGPLPGTEALPLQRWTFVGGSRTLYTFRLNEFPGDRLVLIHTDYRIPIARRFQLPMLGEPTLGLLHYIGMAWSQNVHPSFEQNIGAILQFTPVYVRVITNPRDIGNKVKVNLGVTGPLHKYPWQKPAK